MKRRKHKEKNKHPTVLLCVNCGLVDVTKDDGELENICEACWKIADKANKRAWKRLMKN
jgi:hypothetical protein